MKEDNFSRREWIFIIIIIILVQFVAQYAAFLYSEDSSVLGYISISGTIVSITLALLAIIYSYYQSASQQATSSSINTQIEKLISVVDQVKSSKFGLDEELINLSEIREKIDSSLSLQKKSHFQVKELSEAVDGLMENNLTTSYKEEESSYFGKLVTGGSNIVHIALLIVHYASQYGVELSKIWELIGKKIAMSLHEEFSETLEEYYRGAIMTCITLFAALDYIEIQGESLPLVPSDEFEENLSEFRNFIAARPEEEYKKVIQALEVLSEGL